MKNKSKKVIETEQWVDAYISKNGKPPTYAEIQKQFNLSAAAAHARCKKFREKMNVNEKKVDGIWIKFDRFVPNERIGAVIDLIKAIDSTPKRKDKK